MRRCGTRRVLAGGLAFGLAALGVAGAAAAQAFGFRSLGAAEDAAERIMEASGLLADFEIVVDEGSDNAAAMIASPCRTESGACRVIVYDPLLLLDIERRTDEWGPISIMAHEVAHHLQGHTVFGDGSNPPNEIAADFYSGFILQRLGASLESAQAAMRLIGSPRGSPSHPPRRERLEAIAMGWRRAAALGGGGGGADEALEGARAELEAMRAELRRAERQIQESETRAQEAEDRARAAEEERAAAAEELREVRARGGATEAEVREAEARVRAAEEERAAAAEELEAAAEELEAAVAENERVGEQAEAAAATADRALVLTALLVPLVLAALGLALRKPRREVVRVMDRASRVFRRSPAPPAPVPAPPAPVPAPPFPEAAFTTLPAAPFDGSGLERCAEPGGFVLGRDGALVDATLDHRSVSRRHARLTRRGGRLRVEDLNSTNGTRVNGRRLEPFAPQVLAPGDAVTLGDVDLPLRSA